MGKSYKRYSEEGFERTVSISLADIHIPDSTVAKLLARDFHQIDEMRQRFENGESVFRVVLHERASGGFYIEDGRHRVIAAKLANVGFVEAEVVGRNG